MSDRPGTSAVEMMHHAVGHASRNYYCVECGSPEWSQWTGLVTLGLAFPGRKINEERDQYFHVTNEGRAYLKRLDDEFKPSTTVNRRRSKIRQNLHRISASLAQEGKDNTAQAVEKKKAT